MFAVVVAVVTVTLHILVLDLLAPHSFQTAAATQQLQRAPGGLEVDEFMCCICALSLALCTVLGLCTRHAHETGDSSCV